MAARITGGVLESYMSCAYKGYLKLLGQQGATSDYESLLVATRGEVRHSAIDKISAHNQENRIASNLILTTTTLEQGPLFVLNVTIEDDTISLSFDGLKRVPGASKLGQFHYIPMLFYEGTRIRKEQRLLLDLRALLLSKYQGVSFLKFLLSKVQDVDVFCRRTQRRRQRSSVELYPKEFVPPHLANSHKRKSLQEHDDTEVPASTETDNRPIHLDTVDEQTNHF